MGKIVVENRAGGFTGCASWRGTVAVCTGMSLVVRAVMESDTRITDIFGN